MNLCTSQIIGPFIDTSNLLFGDYSPNIMVHSQNEAPCLFHDQLNISAPSLYIGGLCCDKIASTVTSAVGCDDGPTCL